MSICLHDYMLICLYVFGACNLWKRHDPSLREALDTRPNRRLQRLMGQLLRSKRLSLTRPLPSGPPSGMASPGHCRRASAEQGEVHLDECGYVSGGRVCDARPRARARSNHCRAAAEQARNPPRIAVVGEVVGQPLLHHRSRSKNEVRHVLCLRLHPRRGWARARTRTSLGLGLEQDLRRSLRLRRLGKRPR